MNKTPRLSKSGIEYLDYMWGVWSGCYNWRDGICSGFNCWAKGLATRFKSIYPNGFEPTFYPEALDSPKYLKKPSRIGVGWVGDVIGYASPSVRIAICDAIKHCPQHTFLFLTKNPEKLSEWEFPDNCWVGVSSDGRFDMTADALASLRFIEAKVKYLSFEPLLFENKIAYLPKALEKEGIKWVIIGAQTKPYKPPKMEWAEEIVEACDKAGIPIFEKENLRLMYAKGNNVHPNMIGLRQEMPKEGM